MDEYSDIFKDTLIKAQNGDIMAQNEVFKSCTKMINTLARKYYVLGYDIEDLVQESMLTLFYALKTYKFDKNVTFYHYAKVVAERKIINLIKSANSNKNAPLNESIRPEFDEYNSCIDIENSIEHKVIYNDNFNQLLLKAKQELSQFEIIVLQYYLEGFTIIEIAQKLNKKMKSVDNSMTRIKQKLKKILKEKE